MVNGRGCPETSSSGSSRRETEGFNRSRLPPNHSAEEPKFASRKWVQQGNRVVSPAPSPSPPLPLSSLPLPHPGEGGCSPPPRGVTGRDPCGGRRRPVHSCSRRSNCASRSSSRGQGGGRSHRKRDKTTRRIVKVVGALMGPLFGRKSNLWEIPSRGKKHRQNVHTETMRRSAGPCKARRHDGRLNGQLVCVVGFGKL